jgi:hypothetical protein
MRRAICVGTYSVENDDARLVEKIMLDSHEVNTAMEGVPDSSAGTVNNGHIFVCFPL